jgi:hypothetical protein
VAWKNNVQNWIEGRPLHKHPGLDSAG